MAEARLAPVALNSNIQTKTVCNTYTTHLSTGAKATVEAKRKSLFHENHYRKTALYLFAGEHRKSDIGGRLTSMGWHGEEIDILRGGRAHDLTLKTVQDKIKKRILAGDFTLLMVSPPCNTYSRVRMANHWGPRPVRTLEHPRGLPYLQPGERKTVMLANALVDFTFEAMELHLQSAFSLLILEFPEDLGAITSGTWRGQRPASIFQCEQFLRIAKLPGVVTGGIRQQDFGTSYIKPTRLILKLPGTTLRDCFPGLPAFDSRGYYAGPIPKSTASVGLAKTGPGQAFRTTGTAAWPEQLSMELALNANKSLEMLPSDIDPADKELNQAIFPSTSTTTTTADIFPIESPPENFWVGGTGPPRSTVTFGRNAQYNDGAGLTSPGRWPKNRRIFPAGQRWEQLRTTLDNIIGSDDATILKQLAALACAREDLFRHDWVTDSRRLSTIGCGYRRATTSTRLHRLNPVNLSTWT